MLNKLHYKIFIASFLGAAILLAFIVSREFSAIKNPSTDSSTNQSGTADFGKLPLSFEPNMGQTAQQVQFLSRGKGYTLFLTAGEMVLQMRKSEGGALNPNESKQANTAVLRMTLEGANKSAEVGGQNELAGKSNYFVGDNPNDWLVNVPHFKRVQYKNVYPGIDQVFYGNERELEYDFVVAPEVDAAQIALTFDGADNLEINQAGELILTIGDEQIVQKRPVIYQEIGGERQYVAGNYELKSDDKIGFAIGAYDHAQPLTIDPVLTYSTYLGGGSEDKAYDIAIGATGDAIVTGSTVSADFPVTAGTFQSVKAGALDVFVTRINAAGNSLVYSTFIGGAASETASGIAVDSRGNAFITGTTASTNFPTTAGAFQTAIAPGAFANNDAFVLKLNPTGSALVYSTYLGGGRSGEYGEDVAVDQTGNAFITGSVYSGGDPVTFPTFNAAQPIYGGGVADGFITKLNADGSALVYSTYHGGAAEDTGEAIAIDVSGNAFVAGETISTNMPTTNAFQNVNNGSFDAFAAKFSAAGNRVYSTYLGGFDVDGAGGIAVNRTGEAFVYGTTRSASYPTTANALQPSIAIACSSCVAIDSFLTKLSPTGDTLSYSTFLGGSLGNDQGFDIKLDGLENIFLAGATDASNYPVTPDAVQTAKRNGRDAFFTVLNPAANQVIYSTFFGGSGSNDYGTGVAVNSQGTAFITGYTNSLNLIVTPGAFKTTKEFNDFDAFIARFDGFPVSAFTVSGKVMNQTGKGLSRATVTATDSSGTIRTVTTSRAGTFVFTDLNAGETYTFEIRLKGYRFNPQTITVNDNLTNVNFTALP